MPSVEDIIGCGDLEALFADAVGGRGVPNRTEMMRKIRAFAPLSAADVVDDRDVVAELERCGRWSVLRELMDSKHKWK